MAELAAHYPTGRGPNQSLEAAHAPAGGPSLHRSARARRGGAGRGVFVRGYRPPANGKRATKKTLPGPCQWPRPAPDSSVQACCKALGLSRSNFYYQSCGESAYSPELMRLTGEEFMQHNLKNMLGLCDHLCLADHAANGKRMRQLVRLMDHEPVCPKPRPYMPGQGFTRT